MFITKQFGSHAFKVGADYARLPTFYANLQVFSPGNTARRGGTVTVRTPEFEAVHRELSERRILCDFRPDAGLRLGPHYYNTDDELRDTVVQIAEIVETGAYERHLGVRARF